MARGRFKKPKPLPNGAGISTTLPCPSPALKNFTEYVAAQENRARLMLARSEFTEVVGAIDQVYEAVRVENRNVTPGLGRVYIVCHQSLFAAASAIFRGNPPDAGAASRRALEAARTALALKLDPDGESGAR